MMELSSVQRSSGISAQLGKIKESNFQQEKRTNTIKKTHSDWRFSAPGNFIDPGYIYSLLAAKQGNKQEEARQETGIVGLSRGRFTVAVMRESHWSL